MTLIFFDSMLLCRHFCDFSLLCANSFRLTYADLPGMTLFRLYLCAVRHRNNLSTYEEPRSLCLLFLYPPLLTASGVVS